jgi:hypothetical protein
VKFSAIAKGDRATKVVPLPMYNLPEPVPVLVRVLHGDERAEAVAAGRAYAVSKGIPEPSDGDETFAIGVKAHTLVACCMDAEKPLEPFFASAVEILKNLDPERIAFLYEHWETHQDLHSPQGLTLKPEEFIAAVLNVGGSEKPDFFLSMRPGSRWIFTRTLAARLTSSLEPKSPFGSGSDTPSTPSTSAS